MQVHIFEIIILLVCAALPGIFFISKIFNKKDNDYARFEKMFDLKEINDINKISKRESYAIIHLDKIIVNDQIINLGTQIFVGKQSTQINVNQHYKFYHSYLNQRWDMAIVIANSMKTAWGGTMKTYYETMISRCNHYKINPPGSLWNGIFTKE